MQQRNSSPIETRNRRTASVRLDPASAIRDPASGIRDPASGIGHLLSWYREHGIRYPWRLTRDPYHIWLSEILLQQTRIPVAIRYYNDIVRKFPSLESVNRDPQRFLAAWSGAGYYRRAANMLKCAEQVVSGHSGQFPSDLPSLLRLPGIGRYTAGAIRNVCFEQLTPALDANISRVLARLTSNRLQPGTRGFLGKMEAAFLTMGSGHVVPSELFQSLMELGQRICRIRPDCPACPVCKFCLAFQAGTAEELPVRKTAPRAERWHWYIFLLVRKGRCLFVRNPARTFLKEAWTAPDALSKKAIAAEKLPGFARGQWGIDAAACQLIGSFQHAVTFRRLTVHVVRASGFRLNGLPGRWLTTSDLVDYPTSSVMLKALRLFQTARV